MAMAEHQFSRRCVSFSSNLFLAALLPLPLSPTWRPTHSLMRSRSASCSRMKADIPSDINLCNDNPLASDSLQEDQENMLGEQGEASPHSDASTITKAHNNCTVVKSIRLDICLKSPSHTGLQTSELVKELIKQFPASVPLALVLKKFLADRSLDHSYSGGLSSYCLNLGSLLMYFLYFFGNVFDPRQVRISI